MCVYGFLKYGGVFIIDSNVVFDFKLKSWDLVSGICDFEILDELVGKIGLILDVDIVMFVNN